MVEPVACFNDASGKISVGIFKQTNTTPAGKIIREVL
jgi:hypothetical protein